MNFNTIARKVKQKSITELSLGVELPWIQVSPNAPYFITETGKTWTPIGQNDAITWPDFEGLFRRKNLQQVDNHLAWLASHGITCLRLMLEYAQGEHRYFERPIGSFSLNMVKLWDDLFVLCAKHRIRILLTPVDTFWMWIRWKHHPYNFKNGGPCKKRSGWLICPDTLAAIKNRLTFATERWGGSGVIFAWDLWNEIHPAHAAGRTDVFSNFIDELSQHLRETENTLYGRSHLQTVSLYGPVLDSHPEVADVVLKHPKLDFASTHFYDSASINNPRETVSSAIVTGKLVREALQHLPADKPFFDSEHGPIHAFKDKHIKLPEYFDDEYFRHMQWAHLASGAAGGGMRWPYRHPHCLTHGMRAAQKSMADFLAHIDWKNFRRKNLNQVVQVNNPAIAVFASADNNQAVLWLLRTDSSIKKTRRLSVLNPDASPLHVQVTLPGISEGNYTVMYWNTLDGKEISTQELKQTATGDMLLQLPPVVIDVAVALRKISVQPQVENYAFNNI